MFIANYHLCISALQGLKVQNKYSSYIINLALTNVHNEAYQ